MAFEELKKDFLDADANVRSYIKNSDEYINLKIFKVLMRSITTFAQILLIGSVFLIALLIVSLAVCFGIGQAIDNLFYGFLIVGLFYVIVGVLCYAFREKLNRPLIRRFSNYYFDAL
jgi:membrane protein required for beta-lactamase induction